MLTTLYRDAVEIARALPPGQVTAGRVARVALLQDGFFVLALTRVGERARRWHIPGVSRLIRLTQTALFGIEIGKDVRLGEGVHFVHTVGNILGGDAQLGARVRVMGNVTVGTAKDNGYPVIGDDVILGAGSRILGPVTIGRGAVIGANAVVVTDVPAGDIAMGVPANLRHPARAKDEAGASSR